MEEKNIQNMQILEQRLQNLIMQKQAFQLELDETNSAISELEKSGDEVFKIIGQLMIKTDKSKIKAELTNKQKILELRLNALDKQEETINRQIDKIREELTNPPRK